MLKRITPVRKRRAGGPRRGPLRDKKYRDYVSTHPCAACRKNCPTCHGDCIGVDACVGVKVDPAHTQNNGMASKGDDSTCGPLCRPHHREYDANREAFEKRYGINMRKIAAEHYARYLAERAA